MITLELSKFSLVKHALFPNSRVSVVSPRRKNQPLFSKMGRNQIAQPLVAFVLVETPVPEDVGL